MTQFVFLRHGETDWNLLRRYQGQTDIPLNETGIAQAKKAHDLLANMKFDSVYCSDLTRAVETARLALGSDKMNSVHFDPRLRERGFGSFEGGSYDRSKLDPCIAAAMHANPEEFKFPGGESLYDVEKRVRPFYEMMKTTEPKHASILVISHGTLLSILYFIVKGLPVLDKDRPRLANAVPVIYQDSEE